MPTEDETLAAVALSIYLNLDLPVSHSLPLK